MFSKSTFYECEIYLFGSWRRKDNGDVYTFTVKHHRIEEDFIYREMILTASPAGLPRKTKYSLFLNEDACMLRFEGNDYTVMDINRHKKPHEMQWLTHNGDLLEFEAIHEPAPTYRPVFS